MLPATRLLRTLAATTLAASLLLAGGSGSLVLANGSGDVYASDAKVVLEINSDWAAKGANPLDNAICVPGGVPAPASASPAASGSATPSSSPAASSSGGASASPWPATPSPGCPKASIAAPTQIAFSTDLDTKKLYLATANGTTDLYRIGIENLDVREPVVMSGKVLAIAHPKGANLYVSVAGAQFLMSLGDAENAPVPTNARISQGTPDILAADSRDERLLAAKRGASWVAVVDAGDHVTLVAPSSGGPGGSVVAAVIARAEGAAWVAAADPNVVHRIDLKTHKVLKTAQLPGAPTAIAAMDNYAVVSVGPALYKVDKQGQVTKLATEPADVTQLAADLDANFLYVATASSLFAIEAATPEVHAATIALPNGPLTAMAAVPNKASNILPIHGKPAATSGPGGSGSGNGTTKGSAKPHKTHAPSTDAISDIASGRSVDITTLVAAMAGIILVVTVGSHLVIKRLIRE